MEYNDGISIRGYGIFGYYLYIKKKIFVDTKEISIACISKLVAKRGLFLLRGWQNVDNRKKTCRIPWVTRGWDGLDPTAARSFVF